MHPANTESRTECALYSLDGYDIEMVLLPDHGQDRPVPAAERIQRGEPCQHPCRSGERSEGSSSRPRASKGHRTQHCEGQGGEPDAPSWSHAREICRQLFSRVLAVHASKETTTVRERTTRKRKAEPRPEIHTQRSSREVGKLVKPWYMTASKLTQPGTQHIQMGKFCPGFIICLPQDGLPTVTETLLFITLLGTN